MTECCRLSKLLSGSTSTAFGSSLRGITGDIRTWMEGTANHWWYQDLDGRYCKSLVISGPGWKVLQITGDIRTWMKGTANYENCQLSNWLDTAIPRSKLTMFISTYWLMNSQCRIRIFKTRQELKFYYAILLLNQLINKIKKVYTRCPNICLLV